MDIQVSNTSHIHKFQKAPSNDDRRLAIIEFVKAHQGCSISDIVLHLTETHLGAKKTVENIIEELEKEKVLKKEKPHPNSKKYRITTVSDNPLTYIPYQFTNIQHFYEKLTKSLIARFFDSGDEWVKLYELNFKYKETTDPIIQKITNNDPTLSSLLCDITKKSVISNVISIPFALTDIIYAPYKFLKRTVWINYDNNTYRSLCSFLLSRMDELDQYAMKVYNILHSEPYKMWDYSKNAAYFNTFENAYERFSIVQRMCILRHKCNALGLTKEMEPLLDYLIDNNLEYFSRDQPFLLGEFERTHQNSTKTYIEIIHDRNCPGISNEYSQNCDLLDRDPSIEFTG